MKHSPVLLEWTCCLYYPNRPEYLFLAVFAFSSPFCYAKTAFSYSRDILSPCTPVLFMVKDVVKSKYRMIVMWSGLGAVEALENLLRRQRRNLQRAEKIHTIRNMWSISWKEMITMWSGRAENTFILLLQLWYCNLEKRICQALIKNLSLLRIVLKHSQIYGKIFVSMLWRKSC